MEIGNRNPFIMDQLTARRAVRSNAPKQTGEFERMLENTEETAGPEKAGQAESIACKESENDTDYRKFLLEKMEEMRARIKNGTIQPKIRIGAEAYTQEEWQKLLEKIDAAEDVLKEQIEAEIKAAREAAEDTEEDSDTRIITRPDGARILMITTPFGEMSVELSKPDDSAAFSNISIACDECEADAFMNDEGDCD